MNRIEFLKRFGLLAAVTTLVPGCATQRGGADDDDGEKLERHEHEHDERHEHDEKHEDHDKDDDDDDKREKTPQQQ